MIVHRLGVHRVDLFNGLIQIVLRAVEESSKRAASREVRSSLSRYNLRVQFGRFRTFLINPVLRSYAVLQVRTCVIVHFVFATLK